jgi:hypothetical protein
LKDNIFTDNLISGNGGGIVINTLNKINTLINNIFLNNSASDCGTIYIMDSNYIDSILNMSIKLSKVDYGGGLYLN